MRACGTVVSIGNVQACSAGAINDALETARNRKTAKFRNYMAFQRDRQSYRNGCGCAILIATLDYLAVIIMHRSVILLCLLSWCCYGLVGLASAQSTTTDHRHEVGRRQMTTTMTTTTTTTTMLRRESAAMDGQHRKLAFWGWAFLGTFSLALLALFFRNEMQ
jgi:hypothetical protein